MSIILGEVGNIDRFFSAKHFAGFAGFVPVECESGPHTGEKHLNNGASARLSHAVFMIANCAVAREVAMLSYNILKYNRRYYQKKEDYKAYKVSLG